MKQTMNQAGAMALLARYGAKVTDLFKDPDWDHRMPHRGIMVRGVLPNGWTVSIQGGDVNSEPRGKAEYYSAVEVAWFSPDGGFARPPALVDANLMSLFDMVSCLYIHELVSAVDIVSQL